MDAPQGSATTARKRKRKPADIPAEQTSKKTRRPPEKRKAKGKETEKDQDDGWPDYFKDLYKVFKALNTVLAFCSSRGHLATTFNTVRASVESLTKKPLDLSKVAEIKALLPEIVNFAYTPKIQLRINSNSQQGNNRYPDYNRDQQASTSSSTLGVPYDDDEHVLVLELEDWVKGSRSVQPEALVLPPAMTPQAVKKLIEKRNAMFAKAVNELYEAFGEVEDPATLLQAAARDHLPVNPYANGKDKQDLSIPDPEHRPSIDEVITEIQEQSWYFNQIAYRRIFEEKSGQLGVLGPPLSPAVSKALQDARKITSLYSHQVEAITALSERKDVIVSTSTASGKSVIYQVPLLRFLEEDEDAKAIFIYPTKALAQDQKAALEQLLCACPGLEHIRVATYDGDTPQDARPVIRETASIIFTNFDTIHASILPHEERWRKYLKNLKLVAVDELHYYHNLFGSHVALVMRRLRRICAAVGNRRIRFVSCSATISSPKEHMKAIFGLDDVEVVTEDGAPSGRKDFLVWEPATPHVLAETIELMIFLMKRGVRVILFCKTRKACELAMKTIRTKLSSEGRYDILERVMPYRGGYNQDERRKIEYEAFSGKLLGLIATNALELGVDIGVLDAVLVLGFPISVASLRQQIGRAGRRARDALAILIADNPLEMNFLQNADDLFDKPTSQLIVDLQSRVVLEGHLQCAAQEMPLSVEDDKWFGPLMKEICDAKLRKDKDGWYYTNPKYLPYPAKEVSIRGVEEDKYHVIDLTKARDPGGSPRILEEIEVSRALFELYEGAIFIHQGLTFLVKEISHDAKQAKVIRTDVNWITTPRDFTNVDSVQTFRIREIQGSPQRAYYGRVDVTTMVFGYLKIRNEKILDVVDVEMPPYERVTTGMWFDVSPAAMRVMERTRINPAEAIHSAEHAFLGRFAMAADLRTECKAPEKEYMAAESKRKRPARLIFYDVAPKGAGAAAKAFDHASDILRRTLDIVNACPCLEGCFNCIASHACKENNSVKSKFGAQLVLSDILGVPFLFEEEDIPPMAMRSSDGLRVTVVDAPSVGVAQGVQVEKDNEKVT